MSEQTIYHVIVPESERTVGEDIPDEYRVADFDFHGRKTCIVFGKYSVFRDKPEWIANPPCRWLVKHLIGRLNELVEIKEWRDAYDDEEKGED